MNPKKLWEIVKTKLGTTRAIILLLSCTIIVSIIYGLNGNKSQPTRERPKAERQHEDIQPQAIEQPKDGLAYIWAMPDRGHQSVVILGVVDGNTIDAALLVPIRLKMHHMKAPELEEKGGPEAKVALEKLLASQMRTTQLWGHSRDGTFADFWIPRDSGGSWASKLMIDQGHAK